MRKIRFMVPAAVLALTAFTGDVSAQTATATYEVKSIEEMAVSGNPAALVIDNATKLKDGVTDATTTWNVTSNRTGTKVSAAINTAMPTGVTLTVNLTGPTGATSNGAVALGITAAELVTGITKVQESALTVTYGLKATPSAGIVASATKTVTYTITAGT